MKRMLERLKVYLKKLEMTPEQADNIRFPCC